MPGNPTDDIGDHLLAPITVKWVFDVRPEVVEEFHRWLSEHEESLARELAAVNQGVGYVGTFGVVDPASGYDAVRRYRTYWTFSGESALRGWDPDADQSGALHMKLVNELAHFWMSDSGSWEEIYIPAALGSAYKFAGEYKYLPRGKLM